MNTYLHFCAVILASLAAAAGTARANTVQMVSFASLVEPSTSTPSDKDGYPPTAGNADPEEAMVAARLDVTTVLDAPSATLVDLDADAVDDLSVDGDNPRDLDLLDGVPDGRLAPGTYHLYWNLDKTGYKTNLPSSSAGTSLRDDIEDYRVDVAHGSGAFSSPPWQVLCEGSASISQNDLSKVESAAPATPPQLGDLFRIRAKYEQSSAGGMDSLTVQLYFEGTVLRVESLGLYYYDSNGADPGSIATGVPPGFAVAWANQPSLGPLDLPPSLSSGDHWVVEFELRVWAAGSSWLHPYVQTRPSAGANWKVDSGYGEAFDDPCLIDTEPPQLQCPPDLELECPADPVTVEAWRGTASASDNCSVQLESEIVDHQPGCGASYVDTWRFTAEDGAGNKVTCEAKVSVLDRSAPVLSGVPADVSVECDAVPPPAAPAASDACDPSPIVAASETRIDGSCPGNYQLVRTWTATDACGNTATAQQTVTVRDTTPPEVLPGSSDLACLWPPNHWYVCLRPEDLRPEVSDSCSDPVIWRLAGCASDQPDDAPEGGWNGDGHTTNDCVVLPDGQICVRSERAGTGPGAQAGRRYGVAVIASDACGNESAPVVIGNLHVPHDQSPHAKGCLDPTRVGCRPNQDIPCAGR